jgi:hypothetical protein
MNDHFRRKYRKLTASDTKNIDAIKDAADKLLDILNEIQLASTPGTYADSRSMAVARTKLEECVMWAVKGVTA